MNVGTRLRLSGQLQAPADLLYVPTEMRGSVGPKAALGAMEKRKNPVSTANQTTIPRSSRPQVTNKTATFRLLREQPLGPHTIRGTL